MTSPATRDGKTKRPHDRPGVAQGHGPSRGSRGRRDRGHPGRAARARLGPGHELAHRALGRLHPGVRRRAEAADAEASKALGAEVVLETINANDLQPRITAAMQSGAAPDIIQMLHNWPHLYASGLVDVSDLAEWQAKEQGALLPPVRGATSRWAASTWPSRTASCPACIAYRKSWFDEVGATTFPKTYEELRQVAAKLKKKGKPYGQTLGHTFGDAPGWAYR